MTRRQKLIGRLISRATPARSPGWYERSMHAQSSALARGGPCPHVNDGWGSPRGLSLRFREERIQRLDQG
eukprot:4874153-Pyramimonas_sp.AAC.1